MTIIEAFLIALTVCLYLLIVFLAAWFMGRLMHFCMNDEEEVEQHDDDE